MDKIWSVYCHTNKINNKKYIGITSTNPEYRWRNGNGYKTNTYFYKAIIKYKWDGFNHEILYINLTKEEAFKKEIELIKFYKTTISEFGYNISFGGTAPMFGLKHSKETKLKMSKHNGRYWKGRFISKETRLKISQSKIGSIPWNKNKNHSEETKRKISQKAIERLKIKENNPNYGNRGKLNNRSIKIYCIELNRVFDGIREAGRILDIPSTNIIRSLKSEGKNSAGKQNGIKLHWIYFNTYNKNLLKESNNE